MTLFTVIIICSFTFLFLIIPVFFSLKDLFSKEEILEPDSLHNSSIKISIIVAARNESKNIASLINSLKKLNYPNNDFEVILVDDHSSDGTFEKAKQSLIGTNNFAIYQNENDSSQAKKGALAFGVSKAKFPYLMITDADCKPEAGWLKSFSEKFLQGFDFVSGVAPFNTNKSLINNLAVFENLRASLLTFSLANLGYPYSAASRSFGFSKKAFEEVQGYKNTIETLSGDDDLLLREAVKNNLRVGLVTDKNAFVFSTVKETLKEYLAQKSRHTKTSFHYLLKQKIILGVWHLLNLLFFILPVLIFINTAFIVPFLIKIICDEILILSYQKKFSYNFNAVNIFLMQIIYETFIILNFFNALFRRDKWN